MQRPQQLQQLYTTTTVWPGVQWAVYADSKASVDDMSVVLVRHQHHNEWIKLAKLDLLAQL